MTNLQENNFIEMIGKHFGEIVCIIFNVKKKIIIKALKYQREKKYKIGEILKSYGVINSNELAFVLAIQFDLPICEDIKIEEISDNILKLIPISFAKKNLILPLQKKNAEINLICSDPLDIKTQDELRILLNCDIKLQISTPKDILIAINKSYDRVIGQAKSVVDNLENESIVVKDNLEDDVVDLLDIECDDEGPIIRLVNSLLSQAVKDRASDIHIEPFEYNLLIRFRIDGLLHEIIKPPKRFQNSIVSRIKIMASLNIAEKRLPQDGRIRLKVAGKDIDIRVSTIPTGYGERIVMRLLNRSSAMLNLIDIGFSSYNLKIMNNLINESHGIVLVTGPTGSGKTSTIYACLEKINKTDVNILTIEDPVEYKLYGIGQVQVNKKINLTFASGLRSFLRQDPDVIMVGEIRDRETAEIAIQASLTGHMVLSTVHTNDAAGAVSRLIDMHIEPFLIASSLLAVLAQRLIRKICLNCKKNYNPSSKEILELGLDIKNIVNFSYGKGCKKCQQSGYFGRLGIFELMLIDDNIRKKIMLNDDTNSIKALSRKNGMITLREDGIQKVLKGITTVEEINRVTRKEPLINKCIVY